MMNDVIGAVIVTYNPHLDRTREVIDIVASQVSHVVVVDNSDSEKSRSDLLEFLGDRSSIKLISLGGNFGIGAAQNIGCAHLVDLGCDWIAEFDQDTVVPNNYIEKIHSSMVGLNKINSRVLGLGPITSKSELKAPFPIPTLVDQTLSSGFFYHKDVLKIVGLKDESLFIDLVDWEWCWRARSLGYGTYIDKAITIDHLFGNGSLKIGPLSVGISTPIRIYYQYRNSLFLAGVDYVPFRRRLMLVGSLLVRLFVFVFAFNDRKIRLKMAFLGIVAYLRGVKGKFR